MSNKLIQLADYLDSLGLHKEADYIDYMVVKSAEPLGPDEVMDGDELEEQELNRENKEWAHNECMQKALKKELRSAGLKHLIGISPMDIPEEDIEAHGRAEDAASDACSHIYRSNKHWGEWGASDSEPQRGDGRVEIDPGEMHDLADLMEEKGPSFFKDLGNTLSWKLRSIMPKPIRGLLQGMGPGDPLKDDRDELEEAITRYINKNYENKGTVESIEWGWQENADTYSYAVIVRRPYPGEEDYMEDWVMWIGPLDEYIYYGPTERVGETNYHLAGEW
jgi:hypothetical protein